MSESYPKAGSIAEHEGGEKLWRGAREEVDELDLEQFQALLTSLSEGGTVVIAGINLGCGS